MDWKQYEAEIIDHFTAAYPTARITGLTYLPGRYSLVARQIDLLIEDQIADFQLRIVVDAKHHKRVVDVKGIEEFLGMCSDVGAHKGVLIALNGFTQAAMNRAHYDESDIELDVLNFAEIGEFQSSGAFPFSGSHGLFITAPFGWIIESHPQPDMLAALYQRGMTGLNEAAHATEFIYVNIVHRNETAPSIEIWTAEQDQHLLAKDPSAKLTYNDGPSRKGARTRIRRFESASYPAIEITGFLEFEDFIGQFVMFTQVVAESRNMRKLNHLLRHAQPLNVRHGRGDAPEDTDQLAYVQVGLDELPEDSEMAEGPLSDATARTLLGR